MICYRSKAVVARTYGHVCVRPWGRLLGGVAGARAVRFSVAHGIYAASFLGAVTRGALAYNLRMTNYFE